MRSIRLRGLLGSPHFERTFASNSRAEVRLFVRRCTSSSKHSTEASPQPRGICNAKHLTDHIGLTSFTDDDIRSAFNRLKEQDAAGLSLTAVDSAADEQHDGFITASSIEHHISNSSDYSNNSLTSSEKVEVAGLLSRALVADARTGPLPPADDKDGGEHKVAYADFRRVVHSIGEKIDTRVYPVALCNGLCGIGIGILIPCMPLLVQQINISPSQYGVVVAAFGFARFIANMPAGHFVDVIGRKPMMVGGMGACSLSIFSAGLTLFPGFGVPWLIMSRLMTGMSLSALSAGSNMYIADISNKLNRARMFVPLQTSFHFGMVFGPAIGGVLVSSAGIPGTFFTVGVLCGGITALNQRLLHETMPQLREQQHQQRQQASAVMAPANPSPAAVGEVLDESPPPVPRVADMTAGAAGAVNVVASAPLSDGLRRREGSEEVAAGAGTDRATSTGISNVLHVLSVTAKSFAVSYKEWKHLMRTNSDLAKVTSLNGMFWFVLSGTQMTMLPLLLVKAPFEFNAVEIGGIFAYMSVLTVLTSPVVATVADKYNKIDTLLGSTLLLGCGMALIPQASDIATLCAALAPMAIGATALSSIPAALAVDLVGLKDRAQAQSLVRAAADVGFVGGACSGGLIAQMLTINTTICLNSGLIALAGMTWFINRRLVQHRCKGAGSTKS